MKYFIFSLLLLLFSSYAFSQQSYSESRDWKYDTYYTGADDVGVRVAYDAWTVKGGRTFVLSCVIDRLSNDRVFRFFVATNDPIHKFGQLVDVSISIEDKTYEFSGRVSDLYVGNVHIFLPKEPNEIFSDMKKYSRFTVTIPSISTAVPITQTFSLLGFTKATNNTITNCIY